MSHSLYSVFTRVICISFLLTFTAVFTVSATPLDEPSSKSSPVTIVKEYTYRASENDSKVSARRAALEQIQKAAIEEVGIHIQSSVVNHETVTQGKLKREMQLNFKTFSQALTKTKILEEKWNGETFYIKAQIIVDQAEVSSAINSLTAGKSKEDICAENAEKVRVLFKSAANADRNQELVDIALSTQIDRECNRWQYDILFSIARSKIFPSNKQQYRAFIFSQLTKIKSYEAPELISSAVNYVLADTGNVTDDEWQIILNAMKKMPNNRLRMAMGNLRSFPQYKDKANDIIELSIDGELATPNLSKDKTIRTIIDMLVSKKKIFTAELYLKHQLKNTGAVADDNKLLKNILSIYHWGHKSENSEYAELADKVINYFFDNHSIESLPDNLNRTLYDSLMYPLRKEVRDVKNNASRESDDVIKNQYIKALLKRYPNKMAQIVETYPGNAASKNLFLLHYGLPAKNLCSPKACLKQVSNKKLSTHEQNRYLDYLIAYADKTKVVEKQLVKLLARAQVMPSSVNRTQRKTVLINILSNLKTTDEKAIDLMIKSLKDFDYKVPDTAISALANISTPAFERIKVKYQESESLTQRRMIEAIGQMSPTQDMITFLQSIPEPNKHNQHLKFAIEDAIEMLEMAMLELDQ